MNAKAIVVQEYGGTEVLEVKGISVDLPKEGQALIRLSFIGVNFVDIYQRRGEDPVPLPFTLGLEGSGVVEKIGKGVTQVKPGDRVAFARCEGAYAEFALIPSDRLIPLPDDISLEQGAAFPLQGMTAHYLLHDYRKLSPGDVVLIHGASGGVGLLLVQLAKHLGAQVIGTVSTREKSQAALAAGADHVIINTENNFVKEVKSLTGDRGADLIIDGVGKATFNGNLEASAIRGHIVIFGAASGPADPIGPNTLMTNSISLSGGDLRHFLLTKDELLQRSNELINGIQQGWLKLEISCILPMAKAAEAHRLMESRKNIGKILLSVEH